MLNIDFKKGMWEEHFQYVYNSRFPFRPKFYQKEDYIVNGINTEKPGKFDYTTIMTKKKYGLGTKICLTCSFEDYGAPLIMLTDTLTPAEDGALCYGVGQEVVLWEKGLNVWDFFMEDDVLNWHNLLSAKFVLLPDVKYELCLEITEKYILASVGDVSFSLWVDSLPDEFYIGVTGCENINRLYSLKIEEGKKEN